METPTPSPVTGNPLVSGAHQAVDRIAGSASEIAHGLASQGARLSQAKDEMAGCCRTYVNAHPAITITAAVAAGFVLSQLFRPR